MEATPAGNGEPRARCVLWHGAGADLGALESRLRQRGVSVAHAGSSYAALAELCAAGAPHGTAVSLVMVDPASLGRAAQVVRAAARYAPAAVVWAFEGGPKPQLRPVTEADLVAWGGVDDAPESDIPIRPYRNGLARSPALRLTDHSPPEGAQSAPPPDSDGSGEKPGQSRHILTQEELSMLLGEGEPGGPPGS
jgi:hypothetical protein